MIPGFGNTGMKIFLIVIIQSLMLATIIYNRQQILSSADVIILETRPIDPRSLFRGDYVRLNYTINRLQLDKLAGDEYFNTNETVYVVLKKQQIFWEAVAVFKELPPLEQSQLAIRGIIKSVDNRKWKSEKQSQKKASKINVTYGIENYFVPEGQGLALERPAPGDKVTLEIALDGHGNAAIKALLLNGQPQYYETVF